MNDDGRAHALKDERDEASSARRYRIEAVTRATHILAAIEADGPAGVGEIAQRAGVSPAFAGAALAALERRGLVRAPEIAGAWGLGLAWLQLANAGRSQIDLREIAQPVMRRMRDAANETVVLAIRRGARRVNVEYVESTQGVRRMSNVGSETPLYFGSAGRVLLTGYARAALDDYLRSVVASDGAIVMGLGVDAYIREVEEAKARGYAMASGEVSPDLCSVSTPVRDHTGAVVASLTISSPIDRFTPALEETCIRTAIEGAVEVSRRLGFAGESAAAPE